MVFMSAAIQQCERGVCVCVLGGGKNDYGVKMMRESPKFVNHSSPPALTKKFRLQGGREDKGI